MNSNPGFTFACNLEQFKRIVADFLKTLEDDSMTKDELEQGFKCVGLHYIGIDCKKWEEIIAKSYLDYASRQYFKFQFGR